jgi:cobalamin biosynthesis Mg chelatase CobN
VVDDGTVFYTDFIQGQAVTAATGADVPNLKFLNEFYEIPYEFYIEGRVVITKKLEDTDGNAIDSSETFYAGVFEDPEFTTLCDSVSANVVALPMNGTSEASDTVRMVLSDAETIHLYVTEVDANGTPVSRNADFAYDVTITGSSVSLNTDHTTAETTIINRVEVEQPETKSTIAPRNGPETEPETDSESQTGLQTTPQTEKQTADQTEKQTQASVKTGDDTPVVRYVTLLVVAAVILVISLGLVCRRRRKS